MSRLVLVTSLLCYVVGAALSLDLPSFITPCRMKDPNINECAIKEAKKVMGIISKGIPEVGLPNLIAYKYPDIVYNGTDVKIKYHGGTATGLAGFVVNYVKYDFENKGLETVNRIAKLELDGTYDIDGKLFDTQIKATGPFKITLENIKIPYELKYDLINKDGVEYARETAQTIKLEPESVNINFEKLFDDAEKTAKFNQQINEHKERAVKEIVPSVGVIFKNYMSTNIFENLLELVPFNQIFLPD